MMDLFWQIPAVVVILLVILKIYVERNKIPCTCSTDLTGKTVIVTGANSGIGYNTALNLSRRNARVILACRNKQRGQEAIDKIIAATGNKNVVLKLVSLSSLKSVREFAADIIASESRLDILINNAGIAGIPETRTEDGLEMVMATNHFGPFLLTNLLLELMKRSAPSRIVNVSSMAHGWSKMDFDNVNSEKKFHIAGVYFVSKLANIMFTKELARKLEGTDVAVNSLHPGSVVTNLLNSYPVYINFLYKLIGVLYLKTSEEGAQTTIHVAVSKEGGEVTGKYFSDCRIAENELSPCAKDEGKAKKLWEISERLTGLSKEQ